MAFKDWTQSMWDKIKARSPFGQDDMSFNLANGGTSGYKPNTAKQRALRETQRQAAMNGAQQAEPMSTGMNWEQYPQSEPATGFTGMHAAQPTGYRFFLREGSVAVATDLGYFSPEVESAVSGAQLVLLESNHDPDMLRQNPYYPERLKTRILGRRGHLSNQSGAEAAVRLAQSGTRHLLLGHLSRENNTPELAYRTTCDALSNAGIALGADVTLNVARRSAPGHLYTLR